MKNLIRIIAILFVALSTIQAQELKVRLNPNNILMLEPTDNNKNTLFGLDAGKVVSGYGNTAIGYRSGEQTVNGTTNVFLGLFSGLENTDGSNNTFIGVAAGSSRISGVRNTILGAQAGRNGNGSDNVYLGYAAGLL